MPHGLNGTLWPVQAQWIAQRRESEELSPADADALELFLQKEREDKAAPFSKWFVNEMATMRKEEERAREGSGEIEADEEPEVVEESGGNAKQNKKEKKAKESKHSNEERKKKSVKAPSTLPGANEFPDEVAEFELSDLDE